MGDRGSMALHWKILIGMILGVVVGVVVNLTWDAYTWGALGVGDPASYRAGRQASALERLPADGEPAIAWFLRALEEYAPSAGAEPLEPPSNAYTARVVDWLVRDLSGVSERPATSERVARARDWLLEQVRRVRSQIDEADGDDDLSAGDIAPIARPADETLAADVAWLVSRLSQTRVEEETGEVVSIANDGAGFVAAVPRLIANLNKLIGDLFIRVLRFIAIPLVLFSLIVGASSLNDLRKLSRIGGKTIVLYLCTTAVAITVGLVLANAIRPGTFVPQETRDRLAQMGASEFASKVTPDKVRAAKELSPWDQILNIVPQNPFEALSSAQMLQVVFTALIIGIGLTLIPKAKAAPIVALADGMTEVVIKLVQVLMLAAPVAVFCLISKVVAEMGLAVLGSLVVYSAVVIGGLLVMMFVVYPAILWGFARVGYRRFFRAIAPAQLVAFSSSSSAATLPVTMECAEDRLGVSEEVSSFVLPLGATVNMDGTALYQGVAALFIAQLYQIDVTLTDQLMIILTATLASIGTAAVPSAGLIMLVIVLQQLGFDQAVMAGGIAILFGVDRLLDMCRTVCNITGDSMVATVVAASEGELLSEEEVRKRQEIARRVGIDEHPKEDGDGEYGVEVGSIHRPVITKKEGEDA